MTSDDACERLPCADPAQRVAVGAALTRTCIVCGTAFTYTYPGGPKRRFCDEHIHPGKVSMRRRQEAQQVAEARPEPEPEPEPELKPCRECGTPFAERTRGRHFCEKCRWLTVTCRDCGCDFQAARPRVTTLSPPTTCKSCAHRASREKHAADESALAQLNARLAEEDARRVVQLVEREQQDIRLIDRDGDYDVLVVDGLPAKVRRAVSA